MALPDLAAAADLSIRGIDVTDEDLVATMLGVASATIRRAAGSPILETTSTVSLWAIDEGNYLDLPGLPVTEVASVTYDGTLLPPSEYKLVDGRLWAWRAWGLCSEPIEVVVTLTHGLPEVPADIVDLCASLAGAGIAAAAAGYESHGGKVAEMVGDYQVTWARGAEAVATAVSLPRSTRLWLKAQFGGGASVVTYR